EVIDQGISVKPFDSVPLKSGTLAAGKNRLFLGDNTEGYDTPATTSMSLTLGSSVEVGFDTLTKNLISIKHKYIGIILPLRYTYSAWYVYLTEVLPIGYYALTATEQLVDPGGGSYPTLPT